MPLKNNWANGDVFTPAAANDMANAVNALGTPTATFQALVAATDAAAARTTLGVSTTTPADSRARNALRRSRPSQPRRIPAPGNLGWLNDFIRVYYDGNKFFTDFDITVYRPTGTKRYTDRVNGLNSNSGLGTTLTTALVKGTAVTTLAVAALPATFPSGSKVVIADQDASGTWFSMVATLSSVANSGATSISVTSVVPNFSYSFGSVVANPYGDVYRAYRAAASGDQIVPLDRSTGTYGGCLDRLGGWGFGEMFLGTTGTLSSALSTGSPVTSLSTTALSVAVSNALTVTLESGTESQTFELSASASVGATSISVVSQTPNFAYPVGTVVRYGTRIAKSLAIVPQFPGEMKLIMGNWHGSGASSPWALKATYTKVYICTQVNTSKVVDLNMGGQIGQYVKVADAPACEALPGSFYVSGSEVGVHVIGSGVPDATKVWALMDAEQTTFRNENGNMSVYLDGFSIIGGGTWGGVHVENVNGDDLDFYAKDMTFACNVGADSVNINGARRAFFQNCVAAFSVKDGFNYSPFNRSSVLQHNPGEAQFIEVNCSSWACGDNAANPGTENTFNCSTAHQGSHGLRIGGIYREAAGAVIADVQANCETWTVGCEVYDTRATVDTYKGGIDAQQSGVIMHVYGCRAYGSTYDIIQRAGTTVNVFNSEYDTSSGTLTNVPTI